MLVYPVNNCPCSCAWLLSTHVLVVKMNHLSLQVKRILNAIEGVLTLCCAELLLNARKALHTNCPLTTHGQIRQQPKFGLLRNLVVVVPRWLPYLCKILYKTGDIDGPKNEPVPKLVF